MLYSQGEEIVGKRWVYTSTIEFQPISQSGFGNQALISDGGYGLEFNAMHGLFLTKRIVLSVGTGLNFNFNPVFQSVPLIAELKLFFREYAYKDGLYILLNIGKHLEIGGLDGGQTAKLGAGYVIKTYLNFDVCLELFAKSKTFTDYLRYQDSYNVDSFGFGVGIKF
ncbi:MAG: hypothetical protein EBR30_19635 [Cytophagia bacterium]|nr:hypothetical protein [Cytophagia bacterium]